MRGYAVIDLVTTGPLPGEHDRVIEVAVVHADAAGRATGEWDTLVNPGGDLGTTSGHGIRTSDAMLAPTFAQIAPELLELLAGRVIVAHNAAVETRFLAVELERLGVRTRVPQPTLCTMQLARRYLPDAGRSLAETAAAMGIVLDREHRASADARATAELLGAFIRMDPLSGDWREIERVDGADWPRLAPTGFSFTPRPASARARPLAG
ncbi:DNA polymerase III epsilon subunit-like protein [Conyzicola lurida]|uniref:DNA polymerase III epsilon subunit-like protein n=1 Tax=Conyzicola lurida TaxID=1172621 RepID=A0A841AMY6_9MICO|nr:DNA polymerase III epsilon subunit-like protein [Conyzicola lurida]